MNFWTFENIWICASIFFRGNNHFSSDTINNTKLVYASISLLVFSSNISNKNSPYDFFFDRTFSLKRETLFYLLYLLIHLLHFLRLPILSLIYFRLFLWAPFQDVEIIITRNRYISHVYNFLAQICFRFDFQVFWRSKIFKFFISSAHMFLKI